jgi:hypothetical protein
MELLSWHPDLDVAAMQDVDAVLAWRFPRGVVERLPRLRWVCAMAAGVEKLLVPELPAAVAVSRIVDAEQGRCVAHYVAAMALRHARQLPLYEAQQRRHDWTRYPVAGGLDCTGILITSHHGAVMFANEILNPGRKAMFFREHNTVGRMPNDGCRRDDRFQLIMRVWSTRDLIFDEK